jgi:hypothetical protein
MLKRDRFLSTRNTKKVISNIYKYHVETGGKLKLPLFQKQIPDLMKKWDKLNQIDLYESLVYDPITEMEHINQEFINQHKNMFNRFSHKNTITTTHKFTPESYRQFDAHESKDIIVQNSTYRFDNTFPIYQTSGHNRQYDLSNDGLYNGRSLDNPMDKKYNMNELLDHIDKEYKTIDYNTKPYYGDVINEEFQHYTGWKVDPTAM